MIEYIRRADALKAMDCGNLHRGIVDALQSLILDVPAADVRPVVHGTWVYDDETGEIYCSKCGRTTNDRHDEIQEFDGKKVIALCYPRYCGFCGADMRKEDENV